MIFRKEFYATACIFGGITYFILREFIGDQNLVFVIALSVVISARLLAVIFKISLPNIYKKEQIK